MKLRKYILADFHIRQIIRLHHFNLRSEGAQRFQRMAGDEICQHAAQQRHEGRNAPAREAKGFLRAVHDNRELVIQVDIFGIKRFSRGTRTGTRFSFFIQLSGAGFAACIVTAISGNPASDHIHIMFSGIDNQAIHHHAGYTKKNRRHQRDAPLQRYFLHFRSSITYPSPMRL